MPKHKSSFKVFILFIFGLFLVAGIAIGGLFMWWNQVTQPITSSDSTQLSILIPKGYGVGQIGDLLQEKGLIKNSLAFKLMVKKEALETQLQAGSYSLSKSQSLLEIVQSLTKGVEDFKVTIPEGKRREEVAVILNTEFTKQNMDFSVEDFLSETKDLEGYLFPDTYLFSKTMTTEDVVAKLRATFDDKIPDTTKAESAQLKLSFQQVLILASLVEREAKFQADRPKIARVYLNRLKEAMPLQVDATVQYVKANKECTGKVGQSCNWWPEVLQGDLQYFESPFNTYLNPGLPPTPICNPGLAVIRAVLNPDTHDYIYYLSEPDGTTHYARTLEEHERNIAKYLQ